PYMAKNPRFDISATMRLVEDAVDSPPLFRDYADRLFLFCHQTNWGKRRPNHAAFSAAVPLLG
ncbi:MAG: hypothetical protein KDD44_05970, partial [Bdellovibrionales bacterium]|nr:hypothetical protein [Bdellovibrionales bacterium]